MPTLRASRVPARGLTVSRRETDDGQKQYSKQGGVVNNKKKTLALISLAAVLATASAVLFADPVPKDKTDGQFHLIYVVTVPNLDLKASIERVEKKSYGPVTAAAVKVGAEVDIEPGLLTDGVRFVFAFDYCRRHHPKRFDPVRDDDVRRQYEEQVAPAQVPPPRTGPISNAIARCRSSRSRENSSRCSITPGCASP